MGNGGNKMSSPEHKNLFDRVLNIKASIAMALIMFQVLGITYDVVCRYFFDRPMHGIVSLTEWSLVYITFLGFAWLQREDGHVKMDILTNVLNPKMKIIFNILGNMAGIIVSIIFIYFGFVVVRNQWAIGLVDYFKINYVPVALITVIIPIGSIFLITQLLREIYYYYMQIKES